MKKWLFMALFLCRCGNLSELPTSPEVEEPPPNPAATFTRVQSEIFTPTCAVIACHAVLGTQENLVLTPERSYSEIVGRPSVQMSSLPRVQPGSPDMSYLYRKITGAGITGDRMPQGGPFLNAAQIQLVRDWIRRGAPND